jgi:prepilin-type N-terminal cleavage/methylation domain-containing protein/prepilin-type processing-associated H-X9-DG protein
MVRFQYSRRSGLTLIEMLVVIAIIGVLIGLLLPAVQMVREAARRMSCTNNLRQVALAAHDYHDARGKFPAGAHPAAMVGSVPTGGTNLWVELLPYFEQRNLFEKWDYIDNRNNVAGDRNATTALVIKILLCPSDPLPRGRVSHLTVAGVPSWADGFYGLSSYGGNAGRRSYHPGDPPDFPRLTRDGIFWNESCVRFADITDGSSSTLLFGERFRVDPNYDQLVPVLAPGRPPSLAEVGRWALVGSPAAMMGQVTLHTAVPINYQVPSWGDLSTLDDRGCAFGSGHPGGANFAFADGSVRFVRKTLPLATLQALSTRAGGEVTSADAN